MNNYYKFTETLQYDVDTKKIVDLFSYYSEDQAIDLLIRAIELRIDDLRVNYGPMNPARLGRVNYLTFIQNKLEKLDQQYKELIIFK